MTYTNADILSAVLNRYLQPVIQQLAASKMQSFSFVQALESKVKSSGWVSSNWSLMSEISPLIEPITGNILQPMLKNYLSQVPDEQIPIMAHGIVDGALKNGQLSLFEGKLQFEREDLEELKRLLNYNLPLTEQNKGYEVKLSAPVNEESEVTDGTETSTNK